MRGGAAEQRIARPWPLLLVLALIGSALGCGDPGTAAGGRERGGPAETSGTAETVGPRGAVGSVESSPFAVGAAPPGYRPVLAGQGSARPDWGEDSTGTHEPFTVLSPDGTASGPDVVVVSITGYEGYQGGLDQAGSGYMFGDDVTSFTVDGQDARYHPAVDRRDRSYWADLVAVRGDDLAVRVTSPEATKEELLEVLEQVEVPDDRTVGPAVPDPPEGLQVVGSVDVDGVLASHLYVDVEYGHVPGPASSHVAGWVADAAEGPSNRPELAVASLPGRSVDVAAVPQIHAGSSDAMTEAQEVDVGGRPAVMLSTTSDSGDWARRSVWFEAPWGDVVVVNAAGTPLADEETLVAMAASVQPTDSAGWEAFVVEVTGTGIETPVGRGG